MQYDKCKYVFNDLVTILNPSMDFGTLLGIVRDNDFISWDGDIDISLFAEEYDSSVLDVLRRKGFKVTEFFWEKEWMFKYIGARKGQPIKVHLRRDGIRVGLHLYTKGAGQWEDERFFTVYNNSLFHIKESLLTPMVKIPFLDWMVTVPQEYDKYLTYVYGDWKTPRSKWYRTKEHKESSRRFRIYENDHLRSI